MSSSAAALSWAAPPRNSNTIKRPSASSAMEMMWSGVLSPDMSRVSAAGMIRTFSAPASSVTKSSFSRSFNRFLSFVKMNAACCARWSYTSFCHQSARFAES